MHNHCMLYRNQWQRQRNVNVFFADNDWLIPFPNHPMVMDLMNDDLMFENGSDNLKEDVHRMNALFEICLSEKKTSV